MTRKNQIGSWLAGALGATAVVAGCSSEPEGATSPVSETAEALRGASPSTQAARYAFFEVTHFEGGFRVTAVNGAPFVCGTQGNVSSCSVPRIDLSALNLASTDAATIEGQIGSPWSAPQVLFAGSIVGDALAALEVWRAPAPVHFSGALIEVSHQPQQAFVVNEWSAASVGTLDFSTAPRAEDCSFSDGGRACVPSDLPVETDAPTPTGILVAGHAEEGGKFRVDQYFLAVTVGYDCEGDGYTYCEAGETVCPSGRCSPNGICLIFGGHTLAPTYVRSANATFDSWLVATGQLTSSELPPPP